MNTVAELRERILSVLTDTPIGHSELKATLGLDEWEYSHPFEKALRSRRIQTHRHHPVIGGDGAGNVLLAAHPIRSYSLKGGRK